MAPSKALVLRSVHLPPDMDEQLRGLAFQLRLSKADLIRGFLDMGLQQLQQKFGNTPEDANRDQVLEFLKHPQLPDQEIVRSDEMMRRMEAASADLVPLARPARTLVIEPEAEPARQASIEHF